MFGTGCGGASPQPVASAFPACARSDGRVLEAVPADSDWVFLARPSAMRGSELYSLLLDDVLPRDEQALIQDRYGVETSSTRELAVAQRSRGEALVILSASPDDIAQAISRRAIHVQTRTTPAGNSYVYQLAGNEISIDPVELGASGVPTEPSSTEATRCLSDFTRVAIRGVDSLGPARTPPSASTEPGTTVEVIRGAGMLSPQGRLSTSASALLAFVIPRSPVLPADSGIAVVFSRSEGFSMMLEGDSSSASHIPVTIALFGEYPTTIEANLRALVASIALDPFFDAFGFGPVAQTLVASATDRPDVTRVSLLLGQLETRNALRALTSRTLREMLDISR